MRDALFDGLTHGALFCAMMTALVAASLRQNPLIWAHDAPAAARALLPPPDARTLRQKRAWGAVLFASLALVFGHLAVQIAHAGGGFAAQFVGALAAFELFNLFDAAVIDVAIVVLQPAWAVPEAVRGHPSFRDVRWHLRNFAKGAVGGVAFALIVASIATAVRAIV